MLICRKCGMYDESDNPDFPKYHKEICNGRVVKVITTHSIWAENTGGAE